MSAITTHVLDTALGRPAEGVPVVLERVDAQREWHPLGRGTTDADGRARGLLDAGTALEPGVYRLVFDTTAYFASRQVRGFYPVVIVIAWKILKGILGLLVGIAVAGLIVYGGMKLLEGGK